MHKKLWQRLALVTLLTGGVAVLWGFVAIWGISTYESRMREGMTHENLQVDAQGDAWIQVSQYYPESTFSTPRNQLPYHTLEGEPIEVPEHDFWLSGCTLSHPTSSVWAANDLQGNWQRRVSQIADTGREHWYLVHNAADAEAGRAYLVGYDLRTKMPVGYCSRQGFRTELPAADQWFRVDGRNVGWGQGNCAVISRERHPQISLATLDGWFEFTVRERLYRTIDDTQPYFSVGSCKVTETILTEKSEKLSDRKQVFAARRQDSVVVQHPQQEQQYEFVIPEDFRERRIDFYFVAEDHAVLNTSKGSGILRESVLLTTDAEGEIQKSQPIAWARSPQTSNRAEAYFISLAIPSPAAMGIMFLGFAPTQPNIQRVGWSEADHFERIGILLAEGWPAMLVLLLVSAALTWLALRWHRQYARPHTGAWAVLVFLLGVPGFIAYWAYHRRPALEPCPECNKKVPRNRDACAECQQPFAEPKLLGTEVFV